jgi:hypothetical protein
MTHYSCYRPVVDFILKNGLKVLNELRWDPLAHPLVNGIARKYLCRGVFWAEDLAWWFENDLRSRGMTLHSAIIDSVGRGIVRGSPSPWKSIFINVDNYGGELWRLRYIPRFEKVEGTWDVAINSSDDGFQFENM